MSKILKKIACLNHIIFIELRGLYCNTYQNEACGIFESKFVIFFYPIVLTYVFGAQKNRLIETVLLSTHNICFG